MLKKQIKTLLWLGLVLVPCLIYAQPPIGNEGFAVIKEAYTYDKKLPIHAVIEQTLAFETYNRQKIVFTGVRERVGAYLAIPNKGKKKPFPVILLIDGMGGSKERWFRSGNWPNGLKTVEALTAKGFAVFTLDAAMHGERADSSGLFPPPLSLRKQELMHTVRTMIMQTVKDYMRGLDYLETREDIDLNQVGVYGLSMGGAVTFILTGLDKRIKTAVAGVAVVYGNQFSTTNAYNFAPRITSKPFLMLMGNNDGYYTPKTATELFNSIGGKNNTLIIFKGGHKIPPSYIPTIADWFENRLLK